jgi:hypothetical protein
VKDLNGMMEREGEDLHDVTSNLPHPESEIYLSFDVEEDDKWQMKSGIKIKNMRISRASAL